MLPTMTPRNVIIIGLALAVGTLAVRVVSPGSIYEIDQQAWDNAMKTPGAGDSYELQTDYDTNEEFPWPSWEHPERVWSAGISVASNVPTKDLALFQAGTALSLRPVGYEDPDTGDYSDQWYLCLNFLRVKKGSQDQQNDETCSVQLSFECRANLTDAAVSSFDWLNGTASSPCHTFKLPASCSGQVEPECYVTAHRLLERIGRPWGLYCSWSRKPLPEVKCESLDSTEVSSGRHCTICRVADGGIATVTPFLAT